ncbi:hypothetical protein DPEC_G00226300 [Dallia pectoralis]|uniref:Uncharacterized protein n=1 Tax=Dallia pectoralis TaxID=75939 RepID=A0ACC2G0P5_DALPE|nr:hypothetical protein DPEC_G00226300 [Dallia pectoralis]
MKITAPGMPVKAFTAMLDQRTKQFGRTGKVNAEAFQRSFLQYVYCNSEVDELLEKEPFVCPACSPGSCFSGWQQETLQVPESKPFCRESPGRSVKITAGRAMCGESHWTAARETSMRANKLDEEGVEVAVCRHGFLKEFQGAAFLAMDVTCRYVPNLEKVSEALTHLQPL